jgi:peptidyl-dipeptidase A
LSLKIGSQAKKFKLDEIQDQDIVRKLESLSQIGTSILETNDLDKFNRIANDMEKTYSTAKVPSYKDKKKLFSLDPEITLTLSKSRDPDELEYYWTQWRAQTGVKIRDMYKDYIKLNNKAATLNGFQDATAMKTHPYESDTFVQEMDATWQGLKPLYEQLHAYVRNKLHKKYGNAIVDPEGPMPAHLLGNMWAQSWNNIADMLTPYPEKPSIDVTEEMKKQGWTATTMFQKADEFFQSLGLEPMNKVLHYGRTLSKIDILVSNYDISVKL